MIMVGPNSSPLSRLHSIILFSPDSSSGPRAAMEMNYEVRDVPSRPLISMSHDEMMYRETESTGGRFVLKSKRKARRKKYEI